jgi:hypothetical protein
VLGCALDRSAIDARVPRSVLAHIPNNLRRFALEVQLALLLFSLGCGHANLQPRSAAGPPSDKAVELVVPEQVGATAEPEAPVFSNCVLHAGDAEKHTTRVKRADGSMEGPVVTGKCWYDAECVQDHARETPGDGDVDLHCDGRACVCEYKPLTPAGPVVRKPFELPEDCTSEAQAERLLRERCMANMTFAR